MKDEHRKFNSCIFCGVTLTGIRGPTQRSREHILGDKVANLHPVTENWVASNKQFDPEPKKGSSPITRLTTRSVCSGCNTGWMSRDMNEALPSITSLLIGKSQSLKSGDIRALYRYMARIGIIVDVETSDFELKLDGPDKADYAREFGAMRLRGPALSTEARQSFMKHDAPSSVRAFIGYHPNLLGRNPTFNVVPWINSFNGSLLKRVVFVIGSLAALIEIGNINLHHAPCWLQLENTSNGNVDWPLSNHVGYDEYFAIWVQNEQTRFVRACFNDRRVRRILEAEMRRTGEWRWDLITPDMLG